MTDIPASMKPWHGGIFPPEDWDGGKVLLADGDYEGADTLYQDSYDTGSNQWHHRRPGGIGCDIIAYTPKPPAGGDAGADAADILDHYAQFIRDEVKADDLERHPYLPHIEQVAADLRAALALPAPVVEGGLVPPANGERDPKWRAIKRAVDQFVGRVPSIGKHRALNNAHLKSVVDRLDASGDREAADTIVWQCWHRALDRERERFLMDDANKRIAALSEGSHG